MRRLGVMVALGALLGMLGGVVTASPALARGPQWQFIPPVPFTLDASYCGFEVAVSFPTGNEFFKLLKTPDGSVILLVTGHVTASFTNLATGKNVTENLSAPQKVTVFPDGSVTVAAKGLNDFILTPAEAAQFGLPTVAVTAGALTVSVAADGSITSVSLHGHVVVDVCAALS
jgi:hypothetical protein